MQSFYQILVIGAHMGILRLKNVANDGTKILAHASKHKALSWDHLNKLELQAKEELAKLHIRDKKLNDLINEKISTGVPSRM